MTRGAQAIRLPLAAAIAALLAGCGGVCDSGETQPCACAGAVAGVQLCAADGDGWGECDCSASTDTDTDTDTDVDADTDADTDSDSDTDVDTESDSDTDEGWSSDCPLIGFCQWGTDVQGGDEVELDGAGSVYVGGPGFISKLDAEGMRQWSSFAPEASTYGSGRIGACADGVVYVEAPGPDCKEGLSRMFADGAMDWTVDVPVDEYCIDDSADWMVDLACRDDGVALVLKQDWFEGPWNTGDLYAVSSDSLAADHWALDDSEGRVEVGALTALGSIAFATGLTGASFPGGEDVGTYPGDVFLVSYPGMELAVRWGSPAEERGLGVAATADGIFVCGSTYGDMDGFTSAGGSDAFVTMLDADGAILWTYQWGTAADDVAYSVAVDAAGDVFVAGTTLGTMDGCASAGGKDLFLTKIAADGAPLWTQQWGSAGDDTAASVATDGAGMVYVTGHAAGVLPGSTTEGGVFLLRYLDE